MKYFYFYLNTTTAFLEIGFSDSNDKISKDGLYSYKGPFLSYTMAKKSAVMAMKDVKATRDCYDYLMYDLRHHRKEDCTDLDINQR